jgi:hypothetical protein
MARVEQPLVTRSWTTEETKLPFLQGSYSVIAKQSQTLRDPLGDLWGVDVHCHRRRDAAGGGTVGLQALEFMEGLVEAPLYGGLVAREVGKGVLSVGVSDKGPAKAPLNSTVIKPLLSIYCRFLPLPRTEPGEASRQQQRCGLPGVPLGLRRVAVGSGDVH